MHRIDVDVKIKPIKIDIINIDKVII